MAHILLLRTQHQTNDPTLVGGWTTICGNIQMTFATIAIVLPCSKPFLAVYESDYQRRLSFRGTRSTTPSCHLSSKDRQIRMTDLSQDTYSPASSRFPLRITSPSNRPVDESQSNNSFPKNWHKSISGDASPTAVSSQAAETEATRTKSWGSEYEPTKPSGVHKYPPRVSRTSCAPSVSFSMSSTHASQMSTNLHKE